ncbi:MAG: S10 family peptidase [Terriglobales bacterium]
MTRWSVQWAVVPALALGMITGAAAQYRRPQQQQGPIGDWFRYEPNAKREAKIWGVGAPVETHHSIQLNGQTLNYTVHVGMMPIHNATTGVVEGYMNYTYYSKDGVSNLQNRAITYLYNGGPGSGSIWLHMGAFAPMKIKLEASGLSKPPYGVVPNPDTLLDQSDLCFINAMGTGWSRPTKPEYGADFWGVQNDIASFGEFIRDFNNEYNRWNSPLFLYGESYGTTRSAGLSGYLTDHDIPVTGVVLQSTIIDTDAHAGPLRFINDLPTQAMTAWYHHKVSPNLQKLSADQMSNAAIQFASHEYMQALYDGSNMTSAQRQKALEDLHDFIGLPVSYLDENDLRINLGQFSTELLRAQHEMTGRLDSRFAGYLPNGGAQRTPFDISDANIENSFQTAFENYMRDDLNWKDPDIYYVLGGGIGRWSGSYNTVTNLEDAFDRNPDLKLFVAMGYYDFATPYGGVEWMLSHLTVSPQVRAHDISTGHYQSGHMIYIDTAASHKLRADLRQFYANALAARGTAQ